MLIKNVRFLLNENKDVIGSCIAWQNKWQNSIVSSLHWLIVDQKYHGMGFGKALCCEVMNLFAEQQRLPVYIHTQPWSWKAIFLYLQFSFKLQKTDSFSHYINEYDKAMVTLQSLVDNHRYLLLTQMTDD